MPERKSPPPRQDSSRSKFLGVATKLLFVLSYMTYLSIQVKMADHDMSPLHGKKPCRACTSFKSWMKQENRKKSTAVSFYLTMRLKKSDHSHTKKRLRQSIFEIDVHYCIIFIFIIYFYYYSFIFIHNSLRCMYLLPPILLDNLNHFRA